MQGKYRREHWRTWVRRDLVHLGYWPQYTAAQRDWVRFDARAIVRELREGKIDVLHWGVPENWYPLDAGGAQRHLALADLGYDPYARLIEECHRFGIKILFWSASNCVLDCGQAYYSARRDVMRRHGVHLKPGEPAPRHAYLCLACAEFKRALFATTRAMLKRYDVDGLLIDGPWPDLRADPETGRFRCAYCRESYRRFAGRTRVPRQDWNAPAWREYVRWRHRYVADFLREFCGVIKGVDERLLVTCNNLVTPASMWHDKTDPNLGLGLSDSLAFESTLYGVHLLEGSMKLKFGCAVTDGVPAGLTFKSADLNPGGLADAQPSPVDVATLSSITLMHGGWVDFHSTMDQRARPHPLRTRVYQEVGREIAAKKPWLVNSAPAPHVGIVYSVKTRDNYAGANVPAFMHSFLGAERMMVESHIPTGYLLDRQLDPRHLNRFGCVLLPNVACLSDAEIAAIGAYVRRGGGLIVTGETSLYDGDERFRGEFGLRDVIGVSYQGISERARKVHGGEEPMWKKYPFRLRPHALTAGLGEQDTDLAWLPYFRVAAQEGRETVATWLTLEEDTVWPVNTGRFITGDSGEPCIVAGCCGRGRVVYIASDFTGFYVTRSQRLARELVAAMVEWVAPVPVRALAPKAVELNVLRQDGRRGFVVHLVNYATGNKGYDNMLAHGGYFDAKGQFQPYAPRTSLRPTPRKDMGAEEAALVQPWRVRLGVMEMPVCDENIPVYDVKLRISRQAHPRIRKAYLAPQRMPLRVRAGDTHFEITVPEVKIHQMVVVEVA